MDSTNASPKICPKCGRLCGRQAKFCGGCATKLPDAAALVPATHSMASQPISHIQPVPHISSIPVNPVANSVPPTVSPSAPLSVAPSVASKSRPALSLSAANLKNLTSSYQLNAAAKWCAAAGGIGGWLGHNLSAFSPYHSSLFVASPPIEVLMEQAILVMCICSGISSVLLIADNHQSLRGKWDRDLLRGLPIMAGLGFVAGFGSTLLYWMVGATRIIPWLVEGGIIGSIIGWLRGDKVQAKRGALGGAIGGAIGGGLVDLFLLFSYTDETFLAVGRIGIIITGTLIGLFMRMAQDVLKQTWIVGKSPGLYLGKEYPLNTNRVTVGKSELSDIALYQKSELPLQTGAFVHNNGDWYWEGEPVEINGVAQTRAPLKPGDTLRLGNTEFQFLAKAVDSKAKGAM